MFGDLTVGETASTDRGSVVATLRVA